MQGKKAIAISLLTEKDENDFTLAATIAVQCVRLIMTQQWSFGMYWNVNIPSRALNQEKIDVVVKPLGHRRYASKVHERKDPRGHSYFWIGGPPLPTEPADTDAYWCEQGKIVLTPLHLQCTVPSIEQFTSLERTLSVKLASV